eukprot:1122822-Amorphochlora_amoeboformis.AAC.3
MELKMSKTFHLANGGWRVLEIIRKIYERKTYGTVNFAMLGRHLTMTLRHTVTSHSTTTAPAPVLCGYLQELSSGTRFVQKVEGGIGWHPAFQKQSENRVYAFPVKANSKNDESWRIESCQTRNRHVPRQTRSRHVHPSRPSPRPFSMEKSPLLSAGSPLSMESHKLADTESMLPLKLDPITTVQVPSTTYVQDSQIKRRRTSCPGSSWWTPRVLSTTIPSSCLSSIGDRSGTQKNQNREGQFGPLNPFRNGGPVPAIVLGNFKRRGTQ